MRILHYIPSIDESSGGVGAYMQLLSRDLGKLCELHVVTHRSPHMLTLENCELHFIPLNKNPFSNKSKKEFLQLLNEIKPDVFHTNCCWLPQSARTAIWAKKEGYKVVYTPHGMLEPWIMKRHYWTKKVPAMMLYQRRGLKVADVIHATAESEKDNLLALGWNKNIAVIPNCVRIDEITLKQSWERKKNILFLSRVHVKKGINFLIEAVAMLNEAEQSSYETLTLRNADATKRCRYEKEKSVNGYRLSVIENGNVNGNGNEDSGAVRNGAELLRNADATERCRYEKDKDNGNVNVNGNQNLELGTCDVQSPMKPAACGHGTVNISEYTITIAGPGEDSYVNELKQMASRLGVADMFRFIGPVFGEGKWKLYQEADLFVLPTHSENFGIVVAEALASGTPVITTTGTPWEELNTHHCGWWVPVGTEPLVEALRQFFQMTESELKIMGENGRKLIMDCYSSKSVANQFIEMYETLRER